MKSKATVVVAFRLVVLLVLSNHLNAFTVASASRSFMQPPAMHTSISQTQGHPLIHTRGGVAMMASQGGVSASLPPEGEMTVNGASPPLGSKVKALLDKHFFLFGLAGSIVLANMYPSLGIDGGVFKPELLVGKYGVGLIFLLSGISLPTSDLAQAISNFKLNGLIQGSLFAAWPFLVGLPLKWVLSNVFPNLMPPALRDGLLIMTCLPTTVNMCIMLTSASGGNVATAICNAVLSNLFGIFVTPALLMFFYGTEISLPFVQMVWKLCKKVLLPVAIGQGLRATRAKAIYSRHSKFFKRVQEVVLLGIAWNAFCNAFHSGLGLDLKNSIVLLTLLPIMHLACLGSLFRFFAQPLFNFSRGEVVAATFCSSQKTLAFGLPLINTVFEGNPNLAAYCAPLMMIHPFQMMLGSLLLPTITSYANKEAGLGDALN